VTVNRAVIVNIVAIIFAAAGLAGITFGFEQEQMVEAISIILSGVMAVAYAIRSWRAKDIVGRRAGEVVPAHELDQLRRLSSRGLEHTEELARMKVVHVEAARLLAEKEKELERRGYMIEELTTLMSEQDAKLLRLKEQLAAAADNPPPRSVPFRGTITVLVLILATFVLSACARRTLTMGKEGVSISSLTAGYRGDERFVCNVFHADGSPAAQVSLQSGGAPDEGTLALGSQALAALERLAGATAPDGPRAGPRRSSAPAGTACTPFLAELIAEDLPPPLVANPPSSPPPQPPKVLVPRPEGDGGYDPEG
jgi:hypothetical protein